MSEFSEESTRTGAMNESPSFESRESSHAIIAITAAIIWNHGTPMFFHGETSKYCSRFNEASEKRESPHLP